MKKVINIFLLLLLSLPPQFCFGGIVPFTMENGLIVVVAELDGKEGKFIFDTGASDVLIHSTANLGDQKFSVANEDVSSSEVKISAIRLGDVLSKDLFGYMMNLSSVQSLISGELRGIIGGSIFKNQNVFIDFENSQIEITTKTTIDYSFDHSLEFQNYNNVPVVTLHIGNSVHSFILDTGATTHFVNEDVLMSIDSAEKLSTTTQMITVGGSNLANHYRLFDMKIGDKHIDESKVVASDFSDLLEEVKIDGLLSLSALGSSSVLLDNTHNIIYFN